MACTECQTCISLKSTTKHEQGSYTKCSQEKGSFFTSETTSVTQCTYYFLWNDVSVIKFTAVIHTYTCSIYIFLTKFQYLSTALILEGYNNLTSFTGDHEFQSVPCNHSYSLSHRRKAAWCHSEQLHDLHICDHFLLPPWCSCNFVIS